MISQVFRFGIIGTLAAFVHLGCVFILAEAFTIQPLAANPIGFLVAFILSYFGHARWTFSDSNGVQTKSLGRFFLTAISAWALSQFLYALLLKEGSLHYLTSLFFVLVIVAAVTFVLSRFWVFPKN